MKTCVELLKEMVERITKKDISDSIVLFTLDYDRIEFEEWYKWSYIRSYEQPYYLVLRTKKYELLEGHSSKYALWAMKGDKIDTDFLSFCQGFYFSKKYNLAVYIQSYDLNAELYDVWELESTAEALSWLVTNGYLFTDAG